MKTLRLLPYFTALVVLAWILGSLARSGTQGGSLLSNSVWLVYLIEILPLVGVGLIIGLIVFLVRNWRFLSDAIGFGMSKRPKKKAAGRSVGTIVWMATWLVAVLILLLRCGGLTCHANASVQDAANTVSNGFVSGGPLPKLPTLLGPAVALANLVDTNYFVVAFFGVLAVSSVIMVRALKVSWNEMRDMRAKGSVVILQQGQAAVQSAIRVLEEDHSADARTRILRCYEMMISAAAALGAPVGPEKTARELERGIRGMFQLKGTDISKLTNLFEEARYSLHQITEAESELARRSLLGIREELSSSIVPEA